MKRKSDLIEKGQMRIDQLSKSDKDIKPIPLIKKQIEVIDLTMSSPSKSPLKALFSSNRSQTHEMESPSNSLQNAILKKKPVKKLVIKSFKGVNLFYIYSI